MGGGVTRSGSTEIPREAPRPAAETDVARRAEPRAPEPARTEPARTAPIAAEDGVTRTRTEAPPPETTARPELAAPEARAMRPPARVATAETEATGEGTPPFALGDISPREEQALDAIAHIPDSGRPTRAQSEALAEALRAFGDDDDALLRLLVRDGMMRGGDHSLADITNHLRPAALRAEWAERLANLEARLAPHAGTQPLLPGDDSHAAVTALSATQPSLGATLDRLLPSPAPEGWRARGVARSFELRGIERADVEAYLATGHSVPRPDGRDPIAATLAAARTTGSWPALNASLAMLDMLNTALDARAASLRADVERLQAELTGATTDADRTRIGLQLFEAQAELRSVTTRARETTELRRTLPTTAEARRLDGAARTIASAERTLADGSDHSPIAERRRARARTRLDEALTTTTHIASAVDERVARRRARGLPDSPRLIDRGVRAHDASARGLLTQASDRASSGRRPRDAHDRPVRDPRLDPRVGDGVDAHLRASERLDPSLRVTAGPPSTDAERERRTAHLGLRETYYNARRTESRAIMSETGAMVGDRVVRPLSISERELRSEYIADGEHLRANAGAQIVTVSVLPADDVRRTTIESHAEETRASVDRELALIESRTVESADPGAAREAAVSEVDAASAGVRDAERQYAELAARRDAAHGAEREQLTAQLSDLGAAVELARRSLDNARGRLRSLPSAEDVETIRARAQGATDDLNSMRVGLLGDPTVRGTTVVHLGDLDSREIDRGEEDPFREPPALASIEARTRAADEAMERARAALARTSTVDMTADERAAHDAGRSRFELRLAAHHTALAESDSVIARTRASLAESRREAGDRFMQNERARARETGEIGVGARTFLARDDRADAESANVQGAHAARLRAISADGALAIADITRRALPSDDPRRTELLLGATDQRTAMARAFAPTDGASAERWLNEATTAMGAPVHIDGGPTVTWPADDRVTLDGATPALREEILTRRRDIAATATDVYDSVSHAPNPTGGDDADYDRPGRLLDFATAAADTGLPADDPVRRRVGEFRTAVERAYADLYRDMGTAVEEQREIARLTAAAQRYYAGVTDETARGNISWMVRWAGIGSLASDSVASAAADRDRSVRMIRYAGVMDTFRDGLNPDRPLRERQRFLAAALDLVRARDLSSTADSMRSRGAIAALGPDSAFATELRVRHEVDRANGTVERLLGARDIAYDDVLIPPGMRALARMGSPIELDTAGIRTGEGPIGARPVTTGMAEEELSEASAALDSSRDLLRIYQEAGRFVDTSDWPPGAWRTFVDTTCNAQFANVVLETAIIELVTLGLASEVALPAAALRIARAARGVEEAGRIGRIARLGYRAWEASASLRLGSRALTASMEWAGIARGGYAARVAISSMHMAEVIALQHMMGVGSRAAFGNGPITEFVDGLGQILFLRAASGVGGMRQALGGLALNLGTATAQQLAPHMARLMLGFGYPGSRELTLEEQAQVDRCGFWLSHAIGMLVPSLIGARHAARGEGVDVSRRRVMPERAGTPEARAAFAREVMPHLETLSDPTLDPHNAESTLAALRRMAENPAYREIVAAGELRTLIAERTARLDMAGFNVERPDPRSPTYTADMATYRGALELHLSERATARGAEAPPAEVRARTVDEAMIGVALGDTPPLGITRETTEAEVRSISEARISEVQRRLEAAGMSSVEAHHTALGTVSTALRALAATGSRATRMHMTDLLHAESVRLDHAIMESESRLRLTGALEGVRTPADEPLSPETRRALADAVVRASDADTLEGFATIARGAFTEHGLTETQADLALQREYAVRARLEVEHAAAAERPVPSDSTLAARTLTRLRELHATRAAGPERAPDTGGEAASTRAPEPRGATGGAGPRAPTPRPDPVAAELRREFARLGAVADSFYEAHRAAREEYTVAMGSGDGLRIGRAEAELGLLEAIRHYPDATDARSLFEAVRATPTGERGPLIALLRQTETSRRSGDFDTTRMAVEVYRRASPAGRDALLDAVSGAAPQEAVRRLLSAHATADAVPGGRDRLTRQVLDALVQSAETAGPDPALGRQRFDRAVEMLLSLSPPDYAVIRDALAQATTPSAAADLLSALSTRREAQSALAGHADGATPALYALRGPDGRVVPVHATRPADGFIDRARGALSGDPVVIATVVGADGRATEVRVRRSELGVISWARTAEPVARGRRDGHDRGSLMGSVHFGDGHTPLVYDAGTGSFVADTSGAYHRVIQGAMAVDVAADTASRYDTARERLSSADRARLDTHIGRASSAEEQLMLMRTFSARGELADVAQFQALLHTLFGSTPPTAEQLLRVTTADGLVQYYGHSCGLTTAQYMRAQANPLEALRLVVAGREGVLAEQGEGLRRFGGRAEARGGERELRSVPGAPHLEHAADPTFAFTRAAGTDGIYPDQLAAQLDSDMPLAHGEHDVRYDVAWGDADGELPRPVLEAQLFQSLGIDGNRPPEGSAVQIIWSGGGGHFVLCVGARVEGGAPRDPGRTIYSFRDPASGRIIERTGAQLMNATAPPGEPAFRIYAVGQRTLSRDAGFSGEQLTGALAERFARTPERTDGGVMVRLRNSSGNVVHRLVDGVETHGGALHFRIRNPHDGTTVLVRHDMLARDVHSVALREHPSGERPAATHGTPTASPHGRAGAGTTEAAVRTEMAPPGEGVRWGDAEQQRFTGGIMDARWLRVAAESPQGTRGEIVREDGRTWFVADGERTELRTAASVAAFTPSTDFRNALSVFGDFAMAQRFVEAMHLSEGVGGVSLQRILRLRDPAFAREVFDRYERMTLDARDDLFALLAEADTAGRRGSEAPDLARRIRALPTERSLPPPAGVDPSTHVPGVFPMAHAEGIASTHRRERDASTTRRSPVDQVWRHDGQPGSQTTYEWSYVDANGERVRAAHVEVGDTVILELPADQRFEISSDGFGSCAGYTLTAMVGGRRVVMFGHLEASHTSRGQFERMQADLSRLRERYPELSDVRVEVTLDRAATQGRSGDDWNPSFYGSFPLQVDDAGRVGDSAPMRAALGLPADASLTIHTPALSDGYPRTRDVLVTPEGMIVSYGRGEHEAVATRSAPRPEAGGGGPPPVPEAARRGPPPVPEAARRGPPPVPEAARRGPPPVPEAARRGPPPVPEAARRGPPPVPEAARRGPPPVPEAARRGPPPVPEAARRGPPPVPEAATATARADTRRATPRADLDAMLDSVWARRGELPTTAAIYDALYSRSIEPNPLTPAATGGPRAARDTYLRAISELATGRPDGALAVAQGLVRSLRRGALLPAPLEAYRAGSLPAEHAGTLDTTWYHFYRAGADEGAARDRVYIHPSADAAPEMMAFIVRRIVDNPGDFPGVVAAKMGGPEAVETRADGIVIYTDGPEATQRVLAAMAEFRAAHPGAFRETVPPMTSRVADGVSVGREPNAETVQRTVGRGDGVTTSLSFGQARSEAIRRALSETEARAAEAGPGFDPRAYLRERTDHWLRELGIDPAHPDRNLGDGA